MKLSRHETVRGEKPTKLAGAESVPQPQQSAMCSMLSFAALHSTFHTNIFSRDDPCANCIRHLGSVHMALHPLSCTGPLNKAEGPGEGALPSAQRGWQRPAGWLEPRKTLTGPQPNAGQVWLWMLRFSALASPWTDDYDLVLQWKHLIYNKDSKKVPMGSEMHTQIFHTGGF